MIKDEWKQAVRPHYIFFGTSFGEKYKERNKLVKQILQRITAMPCIMGEEIREEGVQRVITKHISQSVMMIADISGEGESKDNLNTCIEAGIARGANTRFHLIAQGPPRRPPFMFRDQQLWHYDNDLNLLGTIHKIAYPYRRRVLNWELPK